MRFRAALRLGGAVGLVRPLAGREFALRHRENLAQAGLKRSHLLRWRRIGIRNRLHAPIIGRSVRRINTWLGNQLRIYWLL